MNLTIRPETPEEISAIYQVNQLAFDRNNEARLIDNLRNNGAVTLSLVAQMDDRMRRAYPFLACDDHKWRSQWNAVARGRAISPVI